MDGFWMIIRNVEIIKDVELKFGFKRDYMILNGKAKKFMDLMEIKGHKTSKNSRRHAYVMKKITSEEQLNRFRAIFNRRILIWYLIVVNKMAPILL